MQGNNNYLLTIVIVNWNAEKLTIDCLHSVYNDKFLKDNPGKAEIILINNGSAEKFLTEFKNIFPGIKIINNKENQGYAVACNQGMKAAKGKYVLLLGNNTVLKNGALSDCISFLENKLDCGAVGCRLIYPDGRLQGNCKKFPKLKNAFYTYLSLDSLNSDYDMLRFSYDETIEVEQIATTFLMIRNDVLKQIDYFDEQYKILYNDVDLCRKIWDIGYKIYFNHKAEIIHIGSHSTQRAGFRLRKMMYYDILRYFRNNFGFKANILIPVLAVRLLVVSVFR